MKRLGELDFQRIQAVTEAAVAEHHLPGIAVGVVQGGDLAYAEGSGFADIESGRRQDPALRQRIGSITKTMLGLCAMALVDEGRLSLDARVAGLLPDIRFHGPAAGITVWHLLTHTSGIGEMPTPADVRREDGALWADAPEDVRPVAESYPDGIVVDVEPGTKWAYANHAFALLGEIVARAEGAPVEEVLRRRVFAPLGMRDTDCLDRPHADLTTGYHRAPTEDTRELLRRIGIEPKDEPTADGHNIRGAYRYVRIPAAGAVQSTVPDMARYASALLRGGGGIVRPETFGRMVAPQWCPDDRLVSLGLAFWRAPLFGRRAFFHGGGVAGGWNTHLCVFPDDGLAVLLHANVEYLMSDRIFRHIIQAVLDAPEQRPAAAAADARVLASAPGLYEGPPGQLTNFRIITSTGRIRIEAEDGALVLRAQRGPLKEGVRMLPADASDPGFFVLDTPEAAPPRVAFERDAAGAVTGLRMDPCVRLVRAPAADGGSRS